MYEGHTNMDNGAGTDCGSRGWDGQRGAKGENGDNCNRITIKHDSIKNEKIKHLILTFKEKIVM